MDRYQKTCLLILLLCSLAIFFTIVFTVGNVNMIFRATEAATTHQQGESNLRAEGYSVLSKLKAAASKNRTRFRRASNISPTSNPFHDDFDCMSNVDTVVGGDKAKPFSQPWMVYIISQFSMANEEQQCSGVVLSDEWVMTASHCFEIFGHVADSAIVVVAVHDIDMMAMGKPITQQVPKRSIFLHEKFDADYIENDVALVRLPNKLPTDNPHVRHACLPLSGKNPGLNEACTASGWGLRSVNPPLRSVELRTIQAVVAPCQPLRFDNICTRRPADVQVAQDTCQGDSGGPLIWTQNGVPYVVGILSSGSEYCSGSSDSIPATYMRVSEFLEWIKTTIEKKSSMKLRGRVCKSKNRRF